jgi:hypothetical protein
MKLTLLVVRLYLFFAACVPLCRLLSSQLHPLVGYAEVPALLPRVVQLTLGCVGTAVAAGVVTPYCFQTICNTPASRQFTCSTILRFISMILHIKWTVVFHSLQGPEGGIACAGVCDAEPR